MPARKGGPSELAFIMAPGGKMLVAMDPRAARGAEDASGRKVILLRALGGDP